MVSQGRRSGGLHRTVQYRGQVRAWRGGLEAWDYVQAYMWLSLAAAARRDAAKYDFTIVDNYDSSMVEYAVKQRDALAAKMTPEQIAEAKRLAAAQPPAVAAEP